MSYYHYLSDGDIVIDHGNATLKTVGGAIQLEKFGIQYLDCGTSGGVYGLGVDSVLWLVVQITSICMCPHFRYSSTWYLGCLSQIHSVTQHLQSMDGYTVVDQVLDTL